MEERVLTDDELLELETSFIKINQALCMTSSCIKICINVASNLGGISDHIKNISFMMEALNDRIVHLENIFYEAQNAKKDK